MCLYPLTMFRFVNPDTGEVCSTFHHIPETALGYEKLTLPCGKCFECLQSYSVEWANRCYLESTLYKDNCMLTLTYSQTDGSLHRRDIQLFIKRLRKALSVPIRYFYCGEYGSKGGRPHYHCIVFGWRPDDLECFFQRDDHWVYKSKFVECVWCAGDSWLPCVKPGFISVDDLTPSSAKYCAKYMQKLNDVAEGFEKPFTGMSLKPGIGLGAVSLSDLQSDHLYIKGRACSIPRYFRRKFNFEGNVELRRLRGDMLKSSLVARRNDLKYRFGKVVAFRRSFDSKLCLPPPVITSRDDSKLGS